MARWICISQWIVPAIRITIQGLRVGWIWHYAVGRNKPPDHRIIKPGLEVIESKLIILFLAREGMKYIREAGIMGNLGSGLQYCNLRKGI